jgi:16S rRNA (guanine966-N2)-methyltransferase
MTAMRRPATGAASARQRNSGARNRVRIIAGKWRSRIVRFPDAALIRPTPDRVRETLFNWLGQRLEGLDCLDLFAGSGALGFEALSRGARRVVMVERDRCVARALRQSGAELQAQALEVVEGDALAYLGQARETFDLAFVDPPYGSDLARRALDALPARLRPGARVYVESAAPIAFEPSWRVLRQDRAGAVRYALVEHSSP